MSKHVQIIDTFAYNGEPITELRMKYMYPYVDKFVIVEARETHSGKKKDALYIEENSFVFEPYLDKIEFVTIDTFPKPSQEWKEKHRDNYMVDDAVDSWYREQYQRNYGKQIIQKMFADSNYIVICCDVDEIPSLHILQELPRLYFGLTDPVALEMLMFYYNFKWVKPYKWYHAFVVNDLGLSRHTLSDMRTRMSKAKVIHDAGWHGSYFLHTHGLIRKLESFAHRECDVAQHKTREHIKSCLQDGKDISARGSGEDMQQFDIHVLPPMFQDFHHHMVFMHKYA